MTKRNKLYYAFHNLRLEKSLVIILSALLLLFQFVPKRIDFKPPEPKPVFIRFKLEAIPATKQMVRRGMPRPKKPVVPIPSEDVDLPEDATIEETIINWNIGDSPLGDAGLTTGRADTIPPRPLLQVMPEYPESLRKKKVQGSIRLLVRISRAGHVKDVVVADNSTGSKIFEKIAIEAAYKSRYIPANTGSRTIEMWTTCIYSFSPK